MKYAVVKRKVRGNVKLRRFDKTQDVTGTGNSEHVPE